MAAMAAATVPPRMLSPTRRVGRTTPSSTVYHYGDLSGKYVVAPVNPAVDNLTDLAWRGEAACLFTIEGRDPSEMYRTPDVDWFDCSIGPRIDVIHGYKSPLAFIGLGSKYVPQAIYDDVANPSD